MSKSVTALIQDRSDVLLIFAKEALSSSPTESKLFQVITESKDDDQTIQFLMGG